MRFAPSAELTPRRSFLLRLGAGLSLLALAVVAAAPLRGVEVSWPLLAFAGFGAGNGVVLSGAGRNRPRLVRAYWFVSCAAALTALAATVARTT